MPRTSKAVKALTTRFAETKLAREKKHLERVVLELEQLKDSLVPKAEMITYVTTCNALIRSRLMSLPDKLAPRVVGLSIPEASVLMRQAVEELLGELAYEGNASVAEPDNQQFINARLKLVLEELEADSEDHSESVG